MKQILTPQNSCRYLEVSYLHTNKNGFAITKKSKALYCTVQASGLAQPCLFLKLS